MVDGLVELGRYDEAVKVVQQMVDLRPNISSYARVSYIRELYGKYEPAVEAMIQAIKAGAPVGENRAYVTYQLGNLYYNHNNLDKAQEVFQEALDVVPNYEYAQAGMARIKAARGDLNGAISLLSEVTQRFPLQEFLIDLGDIYNLAGKTAEANKQYDLLRAISKIYNANGVDTDLETALFDADHKNNLPQALEKAQKVFAERPSIKAADALAWTLYQTGDYAGAAKASQQSLKLGTQDALFFFHAGMIQAKLGQNNEARTFLEKALTLNPNFSFLHAPEAKKVLNGFGGALASK